MLGSATLTYRGTQENAAMGLVAMRTLTIWILAACAAVGMTACFGASASAAGYSPAWDVKLQALPTNLPPGGSGALQVDLVNIGAGASTSDSTVTLSLPAGVTAVSGGDDDVWECPGAAGATEVTCTLRPEQMATYGGLAPPQAAVPALAVAVTIDANASGVGTSVVTVAGGGATEPDTATLRTRFSSEPAAFEILRFEGRTSDSRGRETRQAGGHPDISTSIDFTSVPSSLGGARAAGNPKDISVDLPAGLVGDPTAVPTCSPKLVGDVILGAQCPPETQVGTVDFSPSYGVLPLGNNSGVPIYNVDAPVGSPGRFAFNVNGVVVNLDPVVHADGGYAITANIHDLSQSLAVVATRLTLWGVPADPLHDPLRRDPRAGFGVPSRAAPRPFITAPTACSGQSLQTSLRVNSWQQPQMVHEASFDRDFAGTPFIVSGCESLSFAPEVKVTPSVATPDSPTGLDVDIVSPQNLDNAPGLAAAQLRDVTVTLPQGLTINPGAADGLAGCSDAELGLGTDAEVTCPAASKIGTVTAVSPLLEDDLMGGVYIRTQASSDPESGDMFRMALVLQNKERGILVKLAGRIRVNELTGRIVNEFDDNPQIPVERVQLHLKTGPRAPLATPGTCGPKANDVRLTSWAGHDVTRHSGFDIACTAGLGGFAPTFAAGTTTSAAGAFSPFAVAITKPDGNAAVSGLSMTLPAGLLASLKGNLNTQVGTVTAFAGPGSNPFALPGKVFLEGAYGDAPFSLRVVVPAKAGPFDLGEVVVRQKIYVDPIDAHVTVVSDPVPTIVKGVPVRLQRLEVNVDKPGFVVNPTSCSAKSIGGVLKSVADQTAPVSVRFQVGDCASLALKPSLALSLSGKGQTTDGKHPAVTANVTQPAGQANLKRVRVALPLSLALDPDNAASDGLCSFVEGSKPDPKCPASSVVGKATATTPILDEPLSGPVYFVKNERKDPKSGRSIKTTPKLVIPLVGQNGVKLTLTGESTVVDDRLVTTFNNIPDAAVSSFKMDIIGGKKGILVISGEKADICKSTQIADQQIDGQNNKQADADVFIQTPSCALKVLSKKVGKSSVAVKVGGLGAGKVTVTGRGIKKTTKTISKSTVATITVKRTKGKPGKVTVSFDPTGPAKARKTTR